MTAHSNLQASAATALSQLLTEHPELDGLTWKVDPIGVLHGELHAQEGDGRIVDDCAAIIGGTAVHSTLTRDGDRLGLAQLVTVWRDVHVEIWASHSEVAAGGAR